MGKKEGKAKSKAVSKSMKNSKSKSANGKVSASSKAKGKNKKKGNESSKGKSKGKNKGKGKGKIVQASGNKVALLLIDLQNDFCPGGSLAVNHGFRTVPVANALSKSGMFDFVTATQDWHPSNHGSFASNNKGKSVGEMGELGGLPQVMWPDHCVQETKGAEFVDGLNLDGVKVFRKGTDPEIDSYSGFFDNGHKKSTGMGEWLVKRGVGTVYIMGIATDYCVLFSALDALEFGFKTYLVEDGCYGVNLKESDVNKALEKMRKKGVVITTASEVLGTSVTISSTSVSASATSTTASGSSSASSTAATSSTA